MPKGLRFSILHRAFRRQMDERVKELGLTGVQFGVLGALGRLEHSGRGEITQKAIEEESRVTHPTMTEIIKKLEKKGFVTCSTSQTDKRCKVISSTPRCIELFHAVHNCDEQIFSDLCRGLSDEDVAALLRITDTMLQNVKAIMDTRELPACRKGCGEP